LKTRQYIDAPEVLPLGGFGKSLYALTGLLLSLPIALAAWLGGVEGGSLRMRCIALGARVMRTPALRNLRLAYQLMFNPIDSTRYFEFRAVLDAISGRGAQRYLDISSPRLMPLFVAQATRPERITILNPDTSDLGQTRELYQHFFPAGSIEFCNETLDQFAHDAPTFDLITSVSVFEHVPQDRELIRAVWSLLAPGAMLVVTVPCARQGWTQYINRYSYGVLEAEDDGYTFWQRFYDTGELIDKFYTVCGNPTRVEVYGERRKGEFYLNTCIKRSTNHYSFWLEPWRMLRGYQRYPSIDALPGEGVVLLVFRKEGLTPSN
jgi:SAM-dependent methyltransferase